MAEPVVVELPRLRPGSAVAARWARARVGMTVGQLLSLGISRGDVRFFLAAGRLVLSGAMPELRRAAPAHHRLTAPTGRPRRCLRCGDEFSSEGPGNRLCNECRRRDVSPYEV